MRTLPRSCEAGQMAFTKPRVVAFSMRWQRRMKYLRWCRRNTPTQGKIWSAPRAVQGANQSTARPVLSTDGEILAPLGASWDSPPSWNSPLYWVVFSCFQPTADLLGLEQAFQRTARASQHNNCFEIARSRPEVTNGSSPRSASKTCCRHVNAWAVRLPIRWQSRFGRWKAQGM